MAKKKFRERSRVIIAGLRENQLIVQSRRAGYVARTSLFTRRRWRRNGYRPTAIRIDHFANQFRHFVFINQALCEGPARAEALIIINATRINEAARARSRDPPPAEFFVRFDVHYIVRRLFDHDPGTTIKQNFSEMKRK